MEAYPELCQMNLDYELWEKNFKVSKNNNEYPSLEKRVENTGHYSVIPKRGEGYFYNEGICTE